MPHTGQWWLANITSTSPKSCDRLVDVAAPLERVAHLRAAQRVEVVHRVRDDLGAAAGLVLGQVEGELRGRLRLGRVLEHEAHAVESRVSWGVRSTITVGSRMLIVPPPGRLAEAGVDVAAALCGSVQPVHEECAPTHGDAGEDVLARRLLHEALGRDDRHASPVPAAARPSMPPKWSTWLCVKITAETGRSPRWRRASAIAAAAVSRVVSGSTTIQPLRPSISVMFETS